MGHRAAFSAIEPRMNVEIELLKTEIYTTMSDYAKK